MSLKERIKALKAQQEELVSLLSEGSGFLTVVDPSGQEKKILLKGGAELIASVMNWRLETRETPPVLNKNQLIDYIQFECDVKDENGTTLTTGAGAASLPFHYYNLNTTKKMARKSAIVDAVLTASSLSHKFSQDGFNEAKLVNDEDRVSSGEAAQVNELTKEQIKKEVTSLVKKLGLNMKADVCGRFGHESITTLSEGQLKTALDMLRSISGDEQGVA